MQQKKELIRLDARLLHVVSNSAFIAELGNGHQFVAYVRRADAPRWRSLRVGDTVSVELSPYDMSKGRVVEGPARVETHES